MTEDPPVSDLFERTFWSKGANRILALGFIVLCGLGPAGLSLSPRHDEPVAVLRLRPDGLMPAAVANADARIVWMSARGHLLILSSASPGLVRALYGEGATLVVAATAVSGCLPHASATLSMTGTRQL